MRLDCGWRDVASGERTCETLGALFAPHDRDALVASRLLTFLAATAT